MRWVRRYQEKRAIRGLLITPSALAEDGDQAAFVRAVG
jgi:hypothetical protein